MFSIGQHVSVLISESSELIDARIVHARFKQGSAMHLILEFSENIFPPIDSQATLIAEQDDHSYQQLAKVTGHWQHSRRPTVEFACVGSPLIVEPQLSVV